MGFLPVGSDSRARFSRDVEASLALGEDSELGKLFIVFALPRGAFEQQNDIHMFLADQAASGGYGGRGSFLILSQRPALAPLRAPSGSYPARSGFWGSRLPRLGGLSSCQRGEGTSPDGPACPVASGGTPSPAWAPGLPGESLRCLISRL